MGDKFLVRLIAISERNTTQLTIINKNSIINRPSIKKCITIKEIIGGGHEVNNNGIIDIDSIRFIKLKSAKSKNLM